MANLFTAAKKVEAKTTAKKKPVKDEYKVEGLAELAALDSLIKSLTAVKATYEANVKSEALEIFKRQVARTTRKPESVRGVDEGASASLEFRKRSSVSALDEEEMRILSGFGVPVGQNVIVEECFRINPNYTNDMALLDKVSAALMKVKDLPADLIEQQPKVYKNIVTDDTITVACRDPKVFDKVAEVIGVLAVKPKLDETDVSNIIDTVKNMVA